MDILGIAAIPVITVICYLIAEAIKATALDNKWLPVLAFQRRNSLDADGIIGEQTWSALLGL